ncbi:bifunctional riboflavin kinase/FAD synthetase [Erysipelothrix sp. HDW6C]|uniref:bifunctional riboflavin kinase/FAD synthetase n=1 Tax=Erysipelothrix sp. HDW6C TaxID=2714930 RepID=UPI0014097A6B|nr:bifunctional riboflavin kinase/FAD synthetase [Erysipelothrix sp. HDW6C]QIK70062.1 bifunctional riboflavin kinase/FAD synthetase [Erysipelothrix sp. HDW6C]
MKQTVIKDHLQLQKFNTELAACIGYFDGLHLGHQHLINETIRVAKERGLESALITFDPDPWTVINDKSHVNHLTPIKEKVRVAQTLGIDHLITINFTKDTSKLTPLEFIESYLVPLNVRALVAGADFRFGHKGAGDVAFLKQHAHYHFDTIIFELDLTKNKKIGTTMITQALLKGNVEEANQLLGRQYEISGFVIDGQKQGRKIGFPTANLDVVDEYVIPAEGVYAGFVEVNGEVFQSMLSIGHNPTFNHTEHLAIETHILDFDRDIYGELLKQTFVAKLRGQIKFDSVDALITQMKADEAKAREILNATPSEL